MHACTCKNVLCEFLVSLTVEIYPIETYPIQGVVVAQLASAQLLEREVPSSILGDLNVCFDLPLFLVAIALNPRKTEH